MPDLAEIRACWDEAARQDAVANIITIPGITLDEFMRLGEVEIDRVLNHIASLGLSHRWRSALDFGCGIGRLSVALARRFEHVTGVDLSGEMIARAIPRPNVKYIRRTSLTRLPTFDFIYSNIVLQHMPPNLQERYVRALVRLLKPDGVAALEIPEGPGSEHGHLSMWGTAIQVVTGWIEAVGGRVADVTPTDSAGNSRWTSHRYTVTRQAVP